MEPGASRVRDGRPRMLDPMIDAPRIVVGVGDLARGVRPLTWAVAEARRRGAEVHAVRAWRDRSQLGAMDLGLRQEIADLAVQTLAEAFALGLGGMPRDITVRMIVREGAPADVLLDYADRDTDLLVLGASRHAGRWHWGSDTLRRCVGQARCPVMVIPPSSLARSAPVRKLVRDLHREIEEFEASTR